MFNIGETVYYARARQTETWISCPDCFETKRLKVVLSNGEELTIACAGCSRGYDPPTGFVGAYVFRSSVEQQRITGVEITERRTQYKAGCYYLDGENVFATKEEAAIRAQALVDEHAAEEAQRLTRKERASKTWAWHVHFYRGEIRHAQEQIARAEAQLGIALVKSKEPVNV